MRLSRRDLVGIALGLGALIFVGVVLAQVGGGYDASFTTTDGGGGVASNGPYVLQNAIGQPVAGNASSAGYSLVVGIMSGGSGAAAAPTGSPSPSPSASPSASTTPSGGPIKRYAPQVASDGPDY